MVVVGQPASGSTTEAARSSVGVVGTGGRPRLEDRGKTLVATKPWAAAGMSERTWYRRRREKRDAGS